MQPEELLRVAAAVEAQSEHPLARVIVAAAREPGIKIPPVDDFRSVTGRGVQARVGDELVMVGSHVAP